MVSWQMLYRQRTHRGHVGNAKSASRAQSRSQLAITGQCTFPELHRRDLRVGDKSLTCAIQMLEVGAAPVTDRFQHRHQRPSILRNRIPYARRYSVLLMPDEYPVPNEVLEMPDEHSFRNFGNAPAQFTGAQRAIGKPPQNRPLPTPVDNRQHGINRAGGHLLLRYWHVPLFFVLTYLSVPLSESV